MSEKVVVVCGRAEGPSLVPGAMRRPCTRCGAEVWASPSTLAARPDELVCTVCYGGGDAAVVRELATRQVALRPEQLPEIEAVAASLPGGQGDALRRAAAAALGRP